ncbi:MAG: HPF/RaiA family ribosome-associated protein [Oscillospiraceae bacterium]|jgi:putative sigma-54 modulation protein|nr:HPF/RaiA family ribosome-associated protein [Oscillospiraceae bacterium]
MEINITSKRAYLNKVFKERVNKKLDHLGAFFREKTVAHVVAVDENGHATIELTIKSGLLHLRAQKTTLNFIESFDLALGAIMQQLRKNKTKLEKSFKAKINDDYDKFLQDEWEAGTEGECQDSEAEYKIVKSKKFFVKPMNVQEAVLQMNLVAHEFFVFLDSETNEPNIVYRRRDGAYGLIAATATLG